jgi:hypothetical protein
MELHIQLLLGLEETVEQRAFLDLKVRVEVTLQDFHKLL